MKLWGPISGLTIEGEPVVQGDDDSFDVPQERAAELALAFGLTFEPPAPPEPPAESPKVPRGRR